MNRIPCKKCPQCGLYNDFTVGECECGRKLNGVEAQFVDTDELSPEEYGKIDTSLKAYVQKCSACGALNYTADPSKPVKVCYNCHKTRIASIAPSPCAEEDGEAGGKKAAAPETEAKAVGDKGQTWHTVGQVMQSEPSDTAEDEDETVQWQDILGSIRDTVGDTQGKKNITLTAVRYGTLSFSVEAGQDTYMLGRSANQDTFLSQDGRVGNEHCYLFFRDGSWFVKDNNSRNGTAVNSRDIGLGGECRLSDGDELKLGHHPDSAAFRISIK